MTDTAENGADQGFGPHVVMRDCKLTIRGVVVTLKENQVLQDHMLIGSCIEGGAPIKPVAESASFTCCPNCGNVFQPKAVHVQPGVLKDLRPSR